MRYKKFKIDFVLAFILIAFSYAALFSQESDSLDRTKPPKIADPKITILPKPQEFTLKNGLPVLFIERHAQPLVSIRLILKGGSYFDNNLPGLASLTSELITKGTKKRTAKDIAQQIEFYGASLNSESSSDFSYVDLDLLKKYFDETLEIFADCILNSTFPPEEIKRCIDRRIDQIAQWKTDPDYLSGREFAKEVFKGHPYSAPSYGDEASLKMIKQKDVINYYKKYFSLQNSFIVVSGDITPDEVLPKFEKLFGKWKKSPAISYKEYKISEPDSTRIFIIDRPKSVQSTINMGFVCMAKKNPDIPYMTLLNTYLGGYFRSQLNANLREKNGYTYGASCGFEARMFQGPFYISTNVRTEVTDKTIDEIFIEIDSLKNKLISDSRLNEVKNYLVGSFPVKLQGNMQIASIISMIKLYDLSYDYYSLSFNKVLNTTGNDIQNLAKKIFENRNYIIAITGDAGQIKDNLQKFGSVRIIK
jgi:zinc protease